MIDLQLSLELAAAFLGGIFVGALPVGTWAVRHVRQLPADVLFDHDRRMVRVHADDTVHFLQKGFTKEASE